MTRVAAYYRTSTVTNEDGHSRQRQEDAVNEYAQRMGYQIEVTRWDVHTGDSTVIDRPGCLLYTSPSPRDNPASRMPSSA